ncbi:hypothetical protein [Thermoflexibacter ruber]|uniref:hypothetical protein n=1 Tax=Thermoflexibacter ruber TaxID=1003 RepID=UPI001160DD13|nr:hypothetical protein [Thermoflexibacter ruber]
MIYILHITQALHAQAEEIIVIFLHYHSRRLVSNLYLQLIKPSVKLCICLSADDVCLYPDLCGGSKAYAEFLPCGFPCKGYVPLCNSKVGLQIPQ